MDRTITLSNGVVMPLVGLGTWQSTDISMKAAIHAAIDAGYRHFDTATWYNNEEAIGEAIQEAIDVGKITRADVFITTKAWASHLHPELIGEALRESLVKLKMDYVDLYLAHTSTAMKGDQHDKSVTVSDIWRGLEKVYRKNLARSIGVSNWSPEQIIRAMKSAIIPIHNCQVEVQIYWPQDELRRVCKQRGIAVTSYGTLGSPARSQVHAPPIIWLPGPTPLEDENVVNLAIKYGKTTAQILLRHMIQRKIAVIPKSSNPMRIAENIQLFDFSLSDEDVKLLDSTTYRQRLFLHDYAIGHPEDPFKSERK